MTMKVLIAALIAGFEIFRHSSPDYLFCDRSVLSAVPRMMDANNKIVGFDVDPPTRYARSTPPVPLPIRRSTAQTPQPEIPPLPTL